MYAGIQQVIERGHGALLGHSKPPGLSGALWAILRRCWEINPADRPTMQAVKSEVRELTE
jgi:hypothetical protein